MVSVLIRAEWFARDIVTGWDQRGPSAAPSTVPQEQDAPTCSGCANGQTLAPAYQRAVGSSAKFCRSVENLICEMDQMLCRDRKASVLCVRGQVDQPFDQLERYRRRRETWQSVDVARVHYTLTRVVADQSNLTGISGAIFSLLFLQRAKGFLVIAAPPV